MRPVYIGAKSKLLIGRAAPTTYLTRTYLTRGFTLDPAGRGRARARSSRQPCSQQSKQAALQAQPTSAETLSHRFMQLRFVESWYR